MLMITISAIGLCIITGFVVVCLAMAKGDYERRIEHERELADHE